MLRVKEALQHNYNAWSGTSWIVEVNASSSRNGNFFEATHRFLTSFRTTLDARLQLVRDRWIIVGWHWIRNTQLHDYLHCYRGNGVGVMAALRPAALNQLSPTCFQ